MRTIIEQPGQSRSILIADADPTVEERLRSAFRQAHVANELVFVADGDQLLEQLHGPDDGASGPVPLPGLIVLDLNISRLDGRRALDEIAADDRLRHIPVIVLTTSDAEEDVYRSYALPVHSYMAKPVTLRGLVAALGGLSAHWFTVREPVA